MQGHYDNRSEDSKTMSPQPFSRRPVDTPAFSGDWRIDLGSDIVFAFPAGRAAIGNEEAKKCVWISPLLRPVADPQKARPRSTRARNLRVCNRPEHTPNEESNAKIYAFFEHFLQRPSTDKE